MYDNGEKVCCICGRTFTGWGNNPYPVVTDKDARCCDECDYVVVIPTRVIELYKRKKGVK